MPTPRTKSYRRGLFPAGLVLLVCGLNWLPYPMGLGLRSAMVGAGIALIAAAFWAPRPAIRVGALMAGVAAFGLLLGLFLMAIRRDRSLERSRFHADRARLLNTLRGVFSTAPGGFPETTQGFTVQFAAEMGGPIHLYKDAEAIELVRWHESLAAKYARAASRPWASVGPDSAPPFDESTDRSIASAASSASRKGAR